MFFNILKEAKESILKKMPSQRSGFFLQIQILLLRSE